MPSNNRNANHSAVDAASIVDGAGRHRHADTPPLTVTLLGTGTSTGVPVLGCGCDVCTSDDPRDTRTRCACYIRAGALGLLIDTGPDFRQQAFRENIDRIDAVCYTHHHFDHVVGLDDLRPFFFQNKTVMPCYAHPDTAAVLRRGYDYIFGSDPYPGAANVALEEVDGPFTVTSRHDDPETLPVDPILLHHGTTPAYGYRIGGFAYLTDVSTIPPASFDGLDGIDVLVLDALRPEPHPSHFSFDEAVANARRIGARRTYFVHMTHNVRHAEANAHLPDDVQLAYDGLTVEVPALEPSGSTP
ncbi:MAG: MBL fold metallo-hydrolase [Bacteroidetes bacterium SW_9_63_38]|nr:MAG: MBL fold metallo-hydrolase [Bacteroidetes bacterium SW_9_63_38]